VYALVEYVPFLKKALSVRALNMYIIRTKDTKSIKSAKLYFIISIVKFRTQFEEKMLYPSDIILNLKK